MTRTPRRFAVSLACLLAGTSLLAQSNQAPANQTPFNQGRKRPMSPALLGIVSDVQSQLGSSQNDFGGGCTIQGDGSLAAPYRTVQAPGFDCQLDAAASPWHARRLYEEDQNQQPVLFCPTLTPVYTLTTDREHARLEPFYYSTQTGSCSFGPACGASVQTQPVILRQGFIDAGICPYGSLSFDARVFDVDTVQCAEFAYATATVEEIHPTSGDVRSSHTFQIDRTMDLQLGLHDWRRLTFHFKVDYPGSLFRVVFQLTTSSCSPHTTQLVYAGGLDLDNVTLLTIPVVDMPNDQITSGCQGGADLCGPPPPVVPQLLLDLGVPMQDAPHDPQSPFSCPQSYCAADLNYDGVIDGQDLAAVLLDWNTLPAPSCDPRWADINGNGTVGGDDLALVLAGWGPCAP